MFIETTQGYINASRIAEIVEICDRKNGLRSYIAHLCNGETRILPHIQDIERSAARYLPARPSDVALVCTTWEEEDGRIGHALSEVAIVGWRLWGDVEDEYASPIIAEETYENRRVGIIRPDGKIDVMQDDIFDNRAQFVEDSVRRCEQDRQAREFLKAQEARQRTEADNSTPKFTPELSYTTQP